ncbi:MAG TPA: GNAT family N-acetyltransferase [Chloroflexia bacterium]|nr:GNAT family N-acetyltransferase [Chloroflexia bacterium]
MFATATELTVTEFDPKGATEAQWAALLTFRNRMLAETFPSDPPDNLAHLKDEMTRRRPFVDRPLWVIWSETGEVLAQAGAWIEHMDTNLHIGEFEIDVLPEHRRQGLGRRLLAAVAERMVQENRRLLMGPSHSTVPASAAVWEHIGGTLGLTEQVNQLTIGELDREMLRVWQERAVERAPGYQLVTWEGAFPESDLPEIAQMYNAMNHAPTGSLDVEDWTIRPDQILERQKAMLERNESRWTMAVREVATGKIAGFTEMHWAPLRPEFLWQHGTAVWPEYRNLGLGRWLKAAMLDHVLAQRPEPIFVRTGNANTNASMLKINEELGFRVIQSEGWWQVEMDKVQAYLGR